LHTELFFQRQQQESDTTRMLYGSKEIETAILNAIQKSAASLGQDFAAFSATMQKSSEAQLRTVMNVWQRNNENLLAEVSEDLSEAARHDKNERVKILLLHSLYFQQLKERHAAIPLAHTKTFNWVFEATAKQDVTWANFAQWLQSDSSDDHIYWVTGKAGSGKSTLMRYIYDDPRTQDLLQKWAKASKLIIASCFFWNAGSTMQKSLSGLLQGLLHALLTKCPNLIQASSPWRWQSYELGARSLPPWSRRELLDTFQRYVVASEGSTRICLFIDGLDEFEGDEAAREEIVDIFQGIAEYEHIKVCLSSRPWLIFEDAFRDRPSLLLQHLTYNDITKYVQEKLEEQSNFRRIKQKDEEGGSRLILGITDKAKGVFLWVFLVVRSLLVGLRNEDGMRDLQRRLDQIPVDLEDYYEQMLGTLEPFYFVQALQLFQVALNAQKQLGLLTYSYMLEDDPDYALNAETKPVSTLEVSERYEPARRRLNSRCKGLLECYIPTVSRNWENFASTMPNATVDFLHRTVRDFMRSSGMQRVFDEHSNLLLDPNAMICNAYLAQIKGTNLQTTLHTLNDTGAVYLEVVSERFTELLIGLLIHARAFEQQNGKSLNAVLDAADLSGSILYEKAYPENAVRPSVHWTNQPLYPHDKNYTDRTRRSNTFLTFALGARLSLYVLQKIAKDGDSKMIHSGPLMDFALSPVDNESGRVGLGIYVDEAKPCFDVLNFLLKQGANPAEIVGGKSVWVHFLARLHRKQGLREDNPEALVPWAETARLFVTQLLAHDRLPANAVGWVKPLQLFSNVFPPEIAHEIENMVVKHSIRQRIFLRIVRSGVDVGSMPRSRSSRMKKRYEGESI